MLRLRRLTNKEYPAAGAAPHRLAFGRTACTAHPCQAYSLIVCRVEEGAQGAHTVSVCFEQDASSGVDVLYRLPRDFDFCEKILPPEFTLFVCVKPTILESTHSICDLARRTHAPVCVIFAAMGTGGQQSTSRSWRNRRVRPLPNKTSTRGLRGRGGLAPMYQEARAEVARRWGKRAKEAI